MIRVSEAGQKGRKLLRRNIWRDIEWKISKADERDQFTDTRSPVNPKQDKYKTTPRHIVFKQWQAKNKEKNFKWARERRYVTFIEAWLFSRNYRSRKVMEWECKGKTHIGICNTHTHIFDNNLYPAYIKNSYKSIRKTQAIQQKNRSKTCRGSLQKKIYKRLKKDAQHH